jgi:uncharacterized protein YjbI with pentapeptide repeats
MPTYHQLTVEQPSTPIFLVDSSPNKPLTFLFEHSFKLSTLKNANCRTVDFAAANLDSANLQGVNLFRANLKTANVSGTKFDVQSVSSR